MVDVLGCAGLVDDVGPLVLGWPKKAVMEALALGFLTASNAVSAALRLRAMLWWMSGCWRLQWMVEGGRYVSEVEVG